MNTLPPYDRRFTFAVSAGLNVFPIKHRAKVPLAKWKGYGSNPATVEEIASWDVSNHNVGVICGEPSNIVVIDVDNAEAQEFIDRLSLPPTPVVRTGKGRHYYFQRPSVELSNRVGVEGLKLDVRADGGYVVGAGSVHPSGARYEWEVSPVEVPFAAMPAELLELIRKPGLKRLPSSHRPKAQDQGKGSRFDEHLAQVKESAVAELAKAQVSTRNDTLFRVAVALANDVAGAGLSWEPFAEALRATALQIGLEEPAIVATLNSSWTTGSSRPTSWMTVAREWVYLSYPDVFYHCLSGRHLKVAGFNNTHAGVYHGKGSFARFLLAGNFVEIAHDLTYRPVLEERFVQQDGLLWYNTYRPSGVTPAAGDASRFAEFVEFLVPSVDEREHLLKMMAWSIRNPGHKLRHALLLRSQAQGLGKSMLIDIWGALLGDHNVRKTTTEELNGNFQGFIKETILVVLEELNWGFGPSGYNRLKDLITSDVAVVNEKFLPVRHWPNLATFVILTNVRTPMVLEDLDRRFFYIDSPAVPRSSAYYADFAGWWKQSLEVIRAYFEEVDLGSFNPYAPPPMTTAKRNLIASGRDDLTKELAELIEERAGAFGRDIVTFKEIELELGSTMRGKSKTNLRDALQSLGAISFGQQRIAGAWLNERFVPASGRASLWAIRNARYWREVGAPARAEEYGRLEGTLSAYPSEYFEILHSGEWPGGEAAFMANFPRD